MRRLDRLLRPKSIAVIGGGFWGNNIVEQCRKIGFEGQIWPVHPCGKNIGGLASYPDIESLPGAPDASFIGVNRETTIDAVAALAGRGSGGAVCFASGFRETDDTTGATMQEKLLNAADGMSIVGPNCYGILNYLDRVALWPDQHGGVPVSSGVAIITQSSNIAINLTMQKRGLPIAYMVTAGNQAQIGLSQIAIELLSDPRVTALGLHIEGIGDIRGFEEMAAQARRLGKPIIALKVGNSEQARTATVSHTASLAGSQAGSRALFERLGIGRVNSIPALLESLKLLHVIGRIPDQRIAAMSCSGGEACLIADAAKEAGLSFPELTDQQRSKLSNVLGPRVTLANPLDYHTFIWGDVEAMSRTFAAMMDAELAIGVVVLDFPRADRCSTEAWEPVIEAVAQARQRCGKPMAIMSSISDTMPEEIAKRLIEIGILPICGITEGLEAIAVSGGLKNAVFSKSPVLLPQSHCQGDILTEAEAKSVIASYGLIVPLSQRIDTIGDIVPVSKRIGFPLVLKGEGVAHKSEAGLVALGLDSADDVLQAALRMGVESFLVEEMITDAVAELLIGVVRDPAHGYVLTLAAGGTHTELLEDSISLLVPATRENVEASLQRLRIRKLLDGYRGAPAANIDAIIDAVMSIQKLVEETHPMEIEINPLMCGTDRAVVADALIITGGKDD